MNTYCKTYRKSSPPSTWVVVRPAPHGVAPVCTSAWGCVFPAVCGWGRFIHGALWPTLSCSPCCELPIVIINREYVVCNVSAAFYSVLCHNGLPEPLRVDFSRPACTYTFPPCRHSQGRLGSRAFFEKELPVQMGPMELPSIPTKTC